MTLFLVRSALCIGAVAVTASGLGPVADALDWSGQGAMERAGRACLASVACLQAAGAATVAGVAPLPPAARAADRAIGGAGLRAQLRPRP